MIHSPIIHHPVIQTMKVATMKHTIFALLALILCTVGAVAQVPRQISYQGLLTDQNGAPVGDGAHTILVKLYTTPTGGTPLHTESLSTATVKGLFNVVIGSQTTISGSVAFDAQYFVGIAVDGGAEMQPRTVLTASPYALNAATAESLSPNATGVVRSLNTVTGAVTLQGGGGTTISNNGNTILISSSGGSGGTGIQGVQNTDGSIAVSNPNGPVATIGIATGGVTSDKLASNAVTSDKITDGSIQPSDLAFASMPPAGNAGGDLNGTYPNPGVAKIQGRSVAATAPNTGQVIKWNGSVWSPANDSLGSGLTLPFSTTVNSTTPALDITQSGSGRAASFSINTATTVDTVLTVNTTGRGSAATFVINNSSGSANINSSPAVFVSSNGFGGALKVTTTTASSPFPAILANTNSSNGSAISAVTSGGGYAGLFSVNNTSNQSGILFMTSNGSGTAAVRTQVTGTSAAGEFENTNSSNTSTVFRLRSNGGGECLATIMTGTANSGMFFITNTSNTADAIYGETDGSGNGLKVNFKGSGTSTSTANNIAIFQANSGNVARIDKTGKGYFNGGTQSNGADVAEAFSVTGNRAAYQPGDVLVISETADRTVEKCSKAYATTVAGVYATKPGVLLTERSSDANMDDLVPMGVVGVIPTKVCNQGGAIHRGDLLVTSDKAGYAMKADRSKVEPGMVIGKALQDFDSTEGTIQVLVNPR